MGTFFSLKTPGRKKVMFKTTRFDLTYCIVNVYVLTVSNLNLKG